MARREDEIAEYLTRASLTQATLAKLAGVSQSTVSRAISSDVKRRGAAYLRLCGYMQKVGAVSPPGRGEEPVIIAFRRIWDHTDEHAAAVAKIIAASGDLGPRSTDREVPS